MKFTKIPLIIDLDGTLIATDMLHESCIGLFKKSPLSAFKIPFWLLKGKAYLKDQLAQKYQFDPTYLPYNAELLQWLKSEKTSGRPLILCTASNYRVAHQIADHLDVFDEVVASDSNNNIAGLKKSQLLEKKFGIQGFDYVGNSIADLHVWKNARNGMVVSSSQELIQKAKSLTTISKIFSPPPFHLGVLGRTFRVHQWLKNILLFVPLLAAHDIFNLYAWTLLLLSFVAFGISASSVYVLNDLLDLGSDREHPRKRNRPFASGAIPIPIGVILTPLLLFGSLYLATFVSTAFIVWLIGYLVLTTLYSLGIKKLVLIDCIVLAILYTLRVVAGAAAIGQMLSFWLLAFSIFIFLSLAFVKRYAELEILILSGREKIAGRGYFASDASLVQTFGIVSGYASVLVLALYLNSESVIALYKTPEMIWGAVPILLFWISWMWFQAHRGKMHDDPLIFAVKDKVSVMTGLVFVCVLILGSVGLG